MLCEVGGSYNKGKGVCLNMKIEIWSDYVCPFCYIGKRQLEKAIQDTGFADQVELVYKSYQLDPNTPTDSTKTMHEALAGKYGMSIEKAKEMTQGVVERAKEVGLDYNFDDTMVENTLKAHRLVKWAEQQGDAAQLVEALLHSYFIEAKRIGQDDVLLAIAEQLGFNREEAVKVLASHIFADAVQADIQEGTQLGVRGVPFFVINQKYGISGAQQQEVFENTLRQVAEEEGLMPGLKMKGATTSYCTDDHCEF